MKKSFFALLCLLALALSPVSASEGDDRLSKGSVNITAQAGFNGLSRTNEPFDALPFPIGGGFEFMATDHIGIGVSFMYDKWCDYLGIYGGTWTFRVFKPAFDIVYHFASDKTGIFEFFTGASLGFNIVTVRNNLGNEYQGEMKSERGPHLAPFIGTNIRFWKKSSGFLGRLMLSIKGSWSITGRFTGVYGTAGITYRLR